MEFAIKCFKIYLCACFLQPLSTILRIAFQTFGFPIPTTVLSLSKQIMFMIPAMLILGNLYSIQGMIWTESTAGILMAVVGMLLLLAMWKKVSSHSQHRYLKRGDKYSFHLNNIINIFLCAISPLCHCFLKSVSFVYQHFSFNNHITVCIYFRLRTCL